LKGRKEKKMTPKSLALIIEGIATPFTAIEKTGKEISCSWCGIYQELIFGNVTFEMSKRHLSERVQVSIVDKSLGKI